MEFRPPHVPTLILSKAPSGNEPALGRSPRRDPPPLKKWSVPLSGPHARVRGRLLQASEALFRDVELSTPVVSLSSLESALHDFLGSLRLGPSLSSPAVRGSTTGRGSRSPTKLTTAERIKRRSDKKFKEAQERGLI